MRIVRWSRGAAAMLALTLAASACAEARTGGPPPPGAEASGAERVHFDIGVTREPCPDGPSEDHGCIYLGTLSDITEGPFASYGLAFTDAQKAFWKRVNDSKGIADAFDVDVETYLRDHKYDPEVAKRLFGEISGKVLALAQTLGPSTTTAILDGLKGTNMLAVPADWSSKWEFEDNIIEVGTNYCVEAMNAIDFAVEEYGSKSVMAIHYDDEYGNDAAAGVKIAAAANKLEFTDVVTPEGPDKQTRAIQQVVRSKPTLVFIATSPEDMAAIVGTAVAQGYNNRFIGSSLTWSPDLLLSPAGATIQRTFELAAPWKTYTSEGTGYDHMRAALGSLPPHDGYTAGWVSSYPMKSLLEKAVKVGDLTREGLLDAAAELNNVDFEGFLPDDAGNYVGEPNETLFRESIIAIPESASPTGLKTKKDFFVGSTAEGYQLTKPCFEAVK
ncbi:MAG: ABC transporter substrate-binding protein [Actinomycetota bacterium]|nr:ABC transporter substrate-binding protein [Actinomycetota bacterium]